MNYKNNGCEKCTKDKLCPECYLGMVEFEYESAKRKLFEAQKAVGIHIQNISFWDIECSQCMNKIEYFRGLIKEKNEFSNSQTS